MQDAGRGCRVLNLLSSDPVWCYVSHTHCTSSPSTPQSQTHSHNHWLGPPYGPISPSPLFFSFLISLAIHSCCPPSTFSHCSPHVHLISIYFQSLPLFLMLLLPTQLKHGQTNEYLEYYIIANTGENVFWMKNYYLKKKWYLLIQVNWVRAILSYTVKCNVMSYK